MDGWHVRCLCELRVVENAGVASPYLEITFYFATESFLRICYKIIADDHRSVNDGFRIAYCFSNQKIHINSKTVLATQFLLVQISCKNCTKKQN